eukprot:scaffold77726_cov51-Phaeocystis_antarctica.AAC.1
MADEVDVSRGGLSSLPLASASASASDGPSAALSALPMPTGAQASPSSDASADAGADAGAGAGAAPLLSSPPCSLRCCALPCCALPCALSSPPSGTLAISADLATSAPSRTISAPRPHDTSDGRGVVKPRMPCMPCMPCSGGVGRRSLASGAVPERSERRRLSLSRSCSMTPACSRAGPNICLARSCSSPLRRTAPTSSGEVALSTRGNSDASLCLSRLWISP